MTRRRLLFVLVLLLCALAAGFGPRRRAGIQTAGTVYPPTVRTLTTESLSVDAGGADADSTETTASPNTGTHNATLVVDCRLELDIQKDVLAATGTATCEYDVDGTGVAAPVVIRTLTRSIDGNFTDQGVSTIALGSINVAPLVVRVSTSASAGANNSAWAKATVADWYLRW